MREPNQAVYASPSIVQHYAQLNPLQPAETAILERLKERLPGMAMLDIGVGGGRTTQHFWPLVGSYIGIDYAADMIDACRQRFVTSQQTIRLAVADARDMQLFADRSFDFILFSFNGIDYVSHGDRLRVVQEIHRVAKPGGYVLFSSHNLWCMAHAFDYRQHIGFNPLKTYENLAMWGLTRLFNRAVSLEQIQTAKHLVLRDESHNFRLQTYYVCPEEQLRQLEFGFDTVEIYPWTQRIPAGLNSDRLKSDQWLYYFCRVNS